MTALQAFPYTIIVADPPWQYGSDKALGSGIERRPNSYANDNNYPSSAFRYGSMSVQRICELKPRSGDNAHLYLWTTNAFMSEAFTVMSAWGFTQKTIITWVKIQKANPNLPSYRMGYYYRGATEHCLFGVKGKIRLTRRDLSTAFIHPRTERHSEKPDLFYDMISSASPSGEKLEMFARKRRDGWHSWGNEIEGTV